MPFKSVCLADTHQCMCARVQVALTIVVVAQSGWTRGRECTTEGERRGRDGRGMDACLSKGQSVYCWCEYCPKWLKVVYSAIGFSSQCSEEEWGDGTTL